ncbi:MAG: hypothetical protein MRY80_15880 [Oricola sp.]|nr:hypothetical protein [Oricola sp.]
MTGSSVVLNPGSGNTIVFNGTIADDSRASIAGSPIAAGQGAGIEISSGLVVFNNTNTYSGQTKISGGVLQADDGVGIHALSNINLAGGVLQTSGTFDRYLGTASDRLQWTGSGGFAAIGGDLTVSVNNGAGLTWGSGSFVGTGDALLFGSSSADSDVYFENAINLAGSERVIVNNGGADGENWLYLDGVLSNGSVKFGDGTTQGTIALTAANTHSGSTTVQTGTTLALLDDGSISSSSLVLQGEFDISGSNGDVSVTTLSGAGDVTLGSNGLVFTNASTTFSGTIDGSGTVRVSGGNQSFSGENTYTGKTTIDAGAELTLLGSGSIEDSSEVAVAGTFDIAATTTGADVKALTGSGNVVLGSKTLAVTDADGTFAGVVSGSGGNFTVESGTQTLTGTNTYTGVTTIEDGAKLALTGSGSIASSSKVVADGDFDISGTLSGASIVTLAGVGDVTLGPQSLVISNGSTAFSGDIAGLGGLTVNGGTQTLSGINSYTGATVIANGASLALTGGGSVAASSGVEANGTFDISGKTSDAEIASLTGSGVVSLGSNSLAVSDASGTFSGGIGGTGGLSIDGGVQTLTGTNTYTGNTTVAEDATLALQGSGSIAASAMVSLYGDLDISQTTAGASIGTLAGDGTVELGTQRLVVTNASTIFSGDIEGTGGFEVSGGTQTLQDVTSQSGILASDGGTVLMNGGSVDGGSSLSAFSIINGGSITATGTTLDTDLSTAYASFDEAGGVATFTLASGTEILGNDGTLLLVERSGAGSDGIVNLIIDNGSSANGDIIDTDAKTGSGGTNVTVATDASWEGLANTASFYIQSGGSVVFDDGSKIDGNLTAEAGANIFGGTLNGALQVYGDAVIDNSAITGNVYIVGNLDLNGLLSPGESPGQIAIGGDLSNLNYADSLFEIEFGVTDPVAGVNYDQTNVGGDVSGVLTVTLANWNSDRGTELGDIGDIELIRIGGAEDNNFVQANRLTQNGREVLLDRRVVTASSTDIVEPSPLTEEEFFGAGDVVVYGLTTIVQDETYGLAIMTGSEQHAIRNTLGTMVDRRGLNGADGPNPAWMRVSASSTDYHDTVDHTQSVYFTEFGTDVLQNEGFRAGLLGSYSKSDSDVTTETGTANLSGQIYSGGIQANWSNEMAYIDAVGQYSFTDWTMTPTNASDLTAKGRTATALVEAGVSIGTDKMKITPWGQFAYQNSTYSDVDSDWVDTVEFADGASMAVRGGIRSEAHFDGFSSFADISVSHELSEDKTVVVDNYEYTTGMGGTQVGLGFGFDADLGGNLSLSSNVKGFYGVDAGEVIGYQGQAKLQIQW